MRPLPSAKGWGTGKTARAARRAARKAARGLLLDIIIHQPSGGAPERTLPVQGLRRFGPSPFPGTGFCSGAWLGMALGGLVADIGVGELESLGLQHVAQARQGLLQGIANGGLAADKMDLGLVVLGADPHL